MTLPDSAERASGLVLGSDRILEKALTATCNTRDSSGLVNPRLLQEQVADTAKMQGVP